ncbi:40042_t:CDS:1, partial [Gigaspora margarita]
ELFFYTIPKEGIEISRPAKDALADTRLPNNIRKTNGIIKKKDLSSAIQFPITEQNWS